MQRVQDFETQDLKADFQPDIPSYRLEECHQLAKKYPMLSEGLPMLPGVRTQAQKYHGQPEAKENLELHLNNWWRPQLTVIGMEGLPSNLAMAGNAIVKSLKFRLSMRLAPTHKGDDIVKLLQKHFLETEQDDTFGAKIEFDVVDVGDGFSAPDLPTDLKSKLN